MINMDTVAIKERSGMFEQISNNLDNFIKPYVSERKAGGKRKNNQRPDL